MSVLSGLFRHTAPLILQGLTDCHSHLLPGVDDGVGTPEEALEMLGRLEALGVRTVWLTPHVMDDLPNPTAMLRERFAALRDAYGGGLTLHLGAENMLDALFLERLAAGDVLPVGRRADMLLVETSCYGAPVNLTGTFEAVRRAGYHPLVAHPERYAYVGRLDEYRHWKEAGARLQLNLLSLAGHYGPEAKDKAEAMLAAGMYDCVGTDLHGERHVQALARMRLQKNIITHLTQFLTDDKMDFH